MDKYIAEKNIGTFSLDDNRYIGELQLNGARSEVTIWGEDKNFKALGSKFPSQVHGTLYDLKKITLLQVYCSSSGSYFDEKLGVNHFCKLNPSYILFGGRHVNEGERCFNALEFVTTDSTALFHDNYSFQSIIHADKNLVESLVNEDIEKSNALYGFSQSVKNIRVGNYPKVFIYTDNQNICSFESVIGRVEINNIPTYNIPSADGFTLKNKVSCRIVFPETVNFKQANDRIAPLLSIFSLILGKPVRLTEYKLQANAGEEPHDFFDVYQCRDEHMEGSDNTIVTQRLIDIESNVTEFETVVSNWLDRQVEWNDARLQFFGSFASKAYRTDRLIKVANMFDIIPDQAYEKNVPLSSEMQQARDSCIAIFKQLPDGLERNSMLGALGRIGTMNLKHKIRARVDVVKHLFSFILDDIYFVTDQSVDCRNYFVHGGKRKFDYYNNFSMIIFFVDTLEFIYGISELVEVGWNGHDLNARMTAHHPFAHYLGNYRMNLERLKLLVCVK